MALNQYLKLSQQQKLSPQQIQLMKLIQIPSISFEQRIKEELEVNPALEEGEDFEEKEEKEDNFDDIENINDSAEQVKEDKEFDYDIYFSDDEVPAYKLVANNTSKDDEHKDIPFSGGSSFQDILITQLGLKNLNEHEDDICNFIIGNIDDDGYIRRESKAIVNDLAFKLNVFTDVDEVERMFKVIQTFDPAGIGARDLQECLLIQLKRKDNSKKEIQIATNIISHLFEEYTKKHYEKIQKKLGISEEELKKAHEEVLRLNPKPGNSSSESSGSTAAPIMPDFIITNVDGELELTLNSKNAPELKISNTYKEMFQEYSRNKESKSGKEALTFIKQKIDSANWFIDAIKQRQHTLMITMHAIMDYQKDYFLEGDDTKIKPMILQDIAEIVNLDISTISRVTSSKYVQTEFGTFSLKSFFSESLSTDSGEDVSTREVKSILDQCIKSEDKKKPYTDDKLAEILNEKGYNIARRTIAKYREQLNIPVARLRKEM
jgi:RNA polymerase sigma-54 factor